MPYNIVHEGKGWYVVSNKGTYLSKHPLPLSTARRQMAAVYANQRLHEDISHTSRKSKRTHHSRSKSRRKSKSKSRR